VNDQDTKKDFVALIFCDLFPWLDPCSEIVMTETTSVFPMIKGVAVLLEGSKETDRKVTVAHSPCSPLPLSERPETIIPASADAVERIGIISEWVGRVQKTAWANKPTFECGKVVENDIFTCDSKDQIDLPVPYGEIIIFSPSGHQAGLALIDSRWMKVRSKKGFGSHVRDHTVWVNGIDGIETFRCTVAWWMMPHKA
jgi:hypothetical protein